MLSNDDSDSATTLGHSSHGLLDDEDHDVASHASSDLLRFTPLKTRMSPPLFISPATHTLNILSQQDTNNLRYDFSQMENDAAAVCSQRSPFSLRSSPAKQQTSINSPSPERMGAQATWSHHEVADSAEPSNVAKELEAFEKNAGIPIMTSPTSKTTLRLPIVTAQAKIPSILEATAEHVPVSSQSQQYCTSLTSLIKEQETLNQLVVHTVTFSEAGPLGISIQHVDFAGRQLCKVRGLREGTQAQGKVQIGDLLCTSSSSDSCKLWLSHRECLKLIHSQRPLLLCVARDPAASRNVAASITIKEACTTTDVTPSSNYLAPSKASNCSSTNERSLVTLAEAAVFICSQKRNVSLSQDVTTTVQTARDKRPSSAKSAEGHSTADNVVIATSGKDGLTFGSTLTSVACLTSEVGGSKSSENDDHHDKTKSNLLDACTSARSKRQSSRCRMNQALDASDVGKMPSGESRRSTDETCQACTLAQEWGTNKHVCKRGLEIRSKLLADGARSNCKACRFELERGWQTNKRFTHTCVRARRKVVGSSVDRTALTVLAIDDKPSGNTTSEYSVKFEDLVTVPYCPACKSGDGEHHVHCPQNPTFHGSTEKRVLKEIYGGVQVGCANCLERFKTGIAERWLKHSLDCPKPRRNRNSSSKEHARAKMTDVTIPSQSRRDDASSCQTDLSTTIPCCLACRDRSVELHHHWCPQHPDFLTSGASLRFEQIRRGTDVGCPNCQFEFERGRPCGLHHSVECSRKRGINKRLTLMRKKSDRHLKGQAEGKTSGVHVVDVIEESAVTADSSRATPLISHFKIPLTETSDAFLQRPENHTTSVTKEDCLLPSKVNTEPAPTVILKLDESIDIDKIEVPFCFACRKKTMMHNVLCPKHPHFEQSGAADKLELIRRGVNIGCQACIFHFSNGYPNKNVEHSDTCVCKASSKKNEKVTNTKNTDAVTEKSASTSRMTQDIPPLTKTSKPLTPKVMTTSISTKGRKVKLSEKAKAKLIDLSDAASLSSERSSSVSSERSNWKPKEKGSHHIRPLLTPVTIKPIETNRTQDKAAKAPPPVSTMKNSNHAAPCRVQTQPVSAIRNTIKVTNGPPAMKKKKETNQDKSDKMPASPVSLSNATIKPKWIKTPNPWGSSEHAEGDVVLALPIDGFTSHELAFSAKRFIDKPFASNSPYRETHVLPEDGVQFLQLSRDRLGLTPWGFTFALHEFGGACLVTSVDSMSPASAAVVHGSTTVASLEVHDLILSVNGGDVGELTELGLEVELEVSGPDVRIAICRYRFPSRNQHHQHIREEAALKSFDEMLRDKTQLGWHELALTADDASVPQLLSPLKACNETDSDAEMQEETESPPIKPAHVRAELTKEFVLGASINQTITKARRESESKTLSPREHRIATQAIGRVTAAPIETAKKQASTEEPTNPEETTCLQGKGTQECSAKDECESADEYDSDENVWSGCVCGEIHESPIPVFWIQCDRCDAWLNVWERCVGMSEKEAPGLDFICWSCHPPDMHDDTPAKSVQASINATNVVVEEKQMEPGTQDQGNSFDSQPVDLFSNAQLESVHLDSETLSRNGKTHLQPRKRRQGELRLARTEKKRHVSSGRRR